MAADRAENMFRQVQRLSPGPVSRSEEPVLWPQACLGDLEKLAVRLSCQDYECVAG